MTTTTTLSLMGRKSALLSRNERAVIEHLDRGEVLEARRFLVAGKQLRDELLALNEMLANADED